jgi:hypothetical protein
MFHHSLPSHSALPPCTATLLLLARDVEDRRASHRSSHPRAPRGLVLERAFASSTGTAPGASSKNHAPPLPPRSASMRAGTSGHGTAPSTHPRAPYRPGEHRRPLRHQSPPPLRLLTDEPHRPMPATMEKPVRSVSSPRFRSNRSAAPPSCPRCRCPTVPHRPSSGIRPSPPPTLAPWPSAPVFTVGCQPRPSRPKQLGQLEAGPGATVPHGFFLINFILIIQLAQNS